MKYRQKKCCPFRYEPCEVSNVAASYSVILDAAQLTLMWL